MTYSEHKQLLREDLERWNNKSGLLLYFTKAEYKLVLRYRWCNYFRSRKLLKPIYYLERYLYHRSCVKCGCDIPSKVTIGGGFQILHAWGIVIHSNAVIGKGCTVLTGALIGKTDTGVPEIGNNVYLGGHSVVVGGVKVGNHATIGAGAIVTSDVPENAVMVCNKAHNIAKLE